MEKQEDIKESLNILSQLATQLLYLKEVWLVLFEEQDSMKHLTLKGHFHPSSFVESTSGIISNMIIIKANAFLDEYNQEFTPSKFPEFSNEIIRIKKSCVPIINQIKKWSGIKSYRNEILGHNLRRKGATIFSQTSEYKIPYTNYDNIALCDLIFMIADQLKYEFETIMKELLTRKVNKQFSFSTNNSIFPIDIENIRIQVEKLRSNTI